MKVLQINSVCGIGSTGRIATDIHNILIEQGHKSYIAYGRDESKSCNNTIKIGNKIDIYEHVALTRIFDKHGFSSKNATKRFIKEIEILDPDIIHLHNIHGYYINIEILFDYLKKSNKPVVWTLHDCWAFTGHCTYFDYVGCEKWKTHCNNCPQKKEYPTSLVFDNSRKNFEKKKRIFNGVKNLKLVTPSNWLKELVEKSFLSDYPVKIINNGIDLQIFKPTNSNFKEKHNINDKFVILGVASVWDRRKGFNYFKELSLRLSEDEIITIVGLTEKQKNNLPRNIIGITKTNDIEELAQIYTAADVFVNPTMEDNFPTTNIESIACGTPVITFNTGGSVESIDQGTGYIVEKEDIEGLLGKIKEIKYYGKNTYKDNCILRAKKCYNKKEKFNEYIEVYEQQVKKSFE
ncbi:MAG: glycosyltransferase family 4 protein [Tissierella sp.]|uniref:glycosyltransferase family 4 protein n=1 Tax=Tissierella sp. TaxID=41274 RepID=UPI003F9A5EDA